MQTTDTSPSQWRIPARAYNNTYRESTQSHVLPVITQACLTCQAVLTTITHYPAEKGGMC